MYVKRKLIAAWDILNMQLIRHKPPFKIMSREETVDYILNRGVSVARYGDGEILLAFKMSNVAFQPDDKELRKNLIKVAKTHRDNLLICLPSALNDYSEMNEEARQFYKEFNARKLHLFYKLFDADTLYGNAFISRCYIDLEDKSGAEKYFEKIKELWRGRDIVIIEGEGSRLGVGNDLFSGAKSIRRILAPAIGAYSVYDEIISAAQAVERSALMLLALGPTATCLACDLSELGYQAIDIGHIDVEYEWMKMGAITKVPIRGKFVNEAGAAGRVVENAGDKEYLSQIIAHVGKTR